MLLGGIESWGGSLRAGDEEIDSAFFVPKERSGDTIGADEILERGDELVVVDTRIPSRFRGEENPIDNVPGRIPERGTHRGTSRYPGCRTARWPPTAARA